jgi:hypothetical protein
VIADYYFRALLPQSLTMARIAKPRMICASNGHCKARDVNYVPNINWRAFVKLTLAAAIFALLPALAFG